MPIVIKREHILRAVNNPTGQRTIINHPSGLEEALEQIKVVHEDLGLVAPDTDTEHYFVRVLCDASVYAQAQIYESVSSRLHNTECDDHSYLLIVPMDCSYGNLQDVIKRNRADPSFAGKEPIVLHVDSKKFIES